MTDKVLLLDESRCTGCLKCVVGCAIAHAGVADATRARIRVYAGAEPDSFILVACQGCEDAFCTDACPTKACRRQPDTARVLIDEERCIGCRTCIVACPFGAPSFDAAAGVTVKCDWCDGDPQCVRLCEPGALTYVCADESSLAKRREEVARRAAALSGLPSRAPR